MPEMDQVSATLSKQDPGHHQARTNLGKESWCGRQWRAYLRGPVRV